MNASQRAEKILALLTQYGQLSVEEAQKECGASAATIRRDFAQLEQGGLAQRTRGGLATSAAHYELPLRFKAGHQGTQKQEIGIKAAALIPDGAIIACNGGTTVAEVARALAVRDLSKLTVVTNAINIACELTIRSHITVMVSGGIVREKSYELWGENSRKMIESLQFDWAILGADAIDVHRGVYCVDPGEAEVNKVMIAQAAKVMVVADSTKINRRSFVRICELSLVDCLVTDSDLPAGEAEKFQHQGVHVIR